MNRPHEIPTNMQYYNMSPAAEGSITAYSSHIDGGVIVRTSVGDYHYTHYAHVYLTKEQAKALRKQIKEAFS